jgi:cytochrome c biogenesis protein CcdA/thiol-disulfide isomerase/thioredoxin
MLLFILSYVGGVLTILSPCILPVLPFVFARADQPFVKSGLPMLLGMAITFAGVATLAAVGGGWAVHANEYGRIVAIVLLAALGVTLLFPSLADRLMHPFVTAGARLSTWAAGDGGSGATNFLSSFILGIATGLLWAPCAGPILGLILTSAALNGANAQTSLLLLAYAAGAATSLALALLIGGRLFVAMKRSLGVGEWVRRGLGVLVLLGVGAIALGLDTGFLTQVSLASTSDLEQGLIDKLGKSQNDPVAMTGGPSMGGAMTGTMTGGPSMTAMTGKPPGANPTGALGVEGGMPELDGAVAWLNSPPLTKEGLRGKVVLIDFWTYSCINCLRAIPYVRAWAEKYKDKGLVVIGVHTPEFAFERNIDNVKRATKDLKIDYPVAIDNDFTIWRAFDNQYWPAHYFIDTQGRIRHHHFGEGKYDESERVIQELLAEAGQKDVGTGTVKVSANGAEAAADEANVKSPETYIGFMRSENFSSPGGTKQDVDAAYTLPPALTLNQWALSGTWKREDERAVLGAAGGRIAFRFHARDLHLVLGPAADSKPVRYRVTIDGKPPGDDHGVDAAADGTGTVTDQRLYQLVRQKGAVSDHTFEIEFLDPGVQAFAFTFG